MVWKVLESILNPQPEPETPTVNASATKASAPPALEVDYEQNCTELYRKIEEAEWGDVTEFLENGYWPGSFFADPMQPKDQARAWVTRFDPEDRSKLKWSQLPLHLAIVIQAPYSIVRRLVELYPQSVRCTDDQNMLPLHLAMRYGNEDRIVDLLLAAFPEAVNAKGKHDRTPLDCAVIGSDSVRGRILNTFVERSKEKATKTVVTQCSREVMQLKKKLQKKELELGDVRSKLSALDSSKAKIEKQLNEKIDALKASQDEITASTNKRIKEIETMKESEEAELQVKISELETEMRELEDAKQSAKKEEVEIRKTLETVQMSVVQSTPVDDVKSLEKEVKSLKNYRLQHTLSKAEMEVDALSSQVDPEGHKEEGTTKQEIERMQKKISDIMLSTSTLESDDDTTTLLQSEVDALRESIQEKEEVSQLKLDVMGLRESLEKQMIDADLSKSEIEIIEASIAPVEAEGIESMGKAQLRVLKADLMKISKKESMKENATECVRNDTKEEREEAEPQGKDALAFTRASTMPALK